MSFKRIVDNFKETLKDMYMHDCIIYCGITLSESMFVDSWTCTFSWGHNLSLYNICLLIKICVLKKNPQKSRNLFWFSVKNDNSVVCIQYIVFLMYWYLSFDNYSVDASVIYLYKEKLLIKVSSMKILITTMHCQI